MGGAKTYLARNPGLSLISIAEHGLLIEAIKLSRLLQVSKIIGDQLRDRGTLSRVASDTSIGVALTSAAIVVNS